MNAEKKREKNHTEKTKMNKKRKETWNQERDGHGPGKYGNEWAGVEAGGANVWTCANETGTAGARRAGVETGATEIEYPNVVKKAK